LIFEWGNSFVERLGLFAVNAILLIGMHHSWINTGAKHRVLEPSESTLSVRISRVNTYRGKRLTGIGAVVACAGDWSSLLQWG